MASKLLTAYHITCLPVKKDSSKTLNDTVKPKIKVFDVIKYATPLTQSGSVT